LPYGLRKFPPTLGLSDWNNLIDFLGGPTTQGSLFDGDLTLNTASKGLVLVTPDGTKKHRARVDNSGNLVTELA
jgi:hypothetical protein